MKCVIVAGGLGTRISEETTIKPKPMIQIGGRPILWHIMKLYSAQGVNDFIICLGYRGYLIKEYFANYYLHMSDVTFNMKSNSMEVHHAHAEPWSVTLIDTGERTMTGGRLKRLLPYLENEPEFHFTYGDGLSNVDLNALVKQHRASKLLATVTGVKPPGRYGALCVAGERVVDFKEKTDGDGGWINGGFFVLSSKTLAYIDGDHTHWEREPLEQLAKERQLGVYFHQGFWQPMDTLREKNYLESLWSGDCAPWKIW